MVIETIKELKRFIKNARKEGKSIGFVPTMGFLHQGHLSLIKKAKEENSLVIVSIFVNPTQFAPGEDFEAYPRNIDNDTQLSMEAGADAIFNPSAEEMYLPGSSTWVEVAGDITSVLCGTSRPTHFRGVTTVVNMLFNIVEPHKAYFGQKDAQQAAVITKMVQDLHMNVEIVVCPIVREADGVALSSRNIYLSEDERKQAAILNKSLQLGKEAYEKGEKNVKVLTQLITGNINQMPLAEIDYVNIHSYPLLETITEINQRAIIAVAVKFGRTRLIDNVILEKQEK